MLRVYFRQVIATVLCSFLLMNTGTIVVSGDILTIEPANSGEYWVMICDDKECEELKIDLPICSYPPKCSYNLKYLGLKKGETYWVEYSNSSGASYGEYITYK